MSDCSIPKPHPSHNSFLKIFHVAEQYSHDTLHFGQIAGIVSTPTTLVWLGWKPMRQVGTCADHTQFTGSHESWVLPACRYPRVTMAFQYNSRHTADSTDPLTAHTCQNFHKHCSGISPYWTTVCVSDLLRFPSIVRLSRDCGWHSNYEIGVTESIHC